MKYQPMISAPKDGTTIQVWIEGADTPVFVRWSIKFNEWVGVYEHCEAVGGRNGAIIVDCFDSNAMVCWKYVDKPTGYEYAY